MPNREGIDYPHLLRNPSGAPGIGFMGILLGLVTFLLAAPLVTQALAGAAWLVTGRPQGWEGYVSSLLRYEHPWGIVAGHMGLAVLIPIALGLVAFVHKTPPGLLWSVEGRPRWRFGLVSLATAAIILTGVLSLQISMSDQSLVWSPQDHWAAFLLAVLITSPIQAVAEEAFFRGYLMQAFGSMVAPPWFGIVSSAVVFALFHAGQNVPLFAVRFAFGLVAGWLVWRTGGLEAGIAAHVVNNLMAFGLAAFTGSIAQIKATTEITWSDAVWDLLRFGLFALAAAGIALKMRVPRVSTGSV